MGDEGGTLPSLIFLSSHLSARICRMPIVLTSFLINLLLPIKMEASITTSRSRRSRWMRLEAADILLRRCISTFQLC